MRNTFLAKKKNSAQPPIHQSTGLFSFIIAPHGPVLHMQTANQFRRRHRHRLQS